MSILLLALLYAIAARAFLFEIKFESFRARLAEKHRLIDVFLSCPFCNGFWTGLFSYLILIWNPFTFQFDVSHIIHMLYFSVTVGFLGWLQSRHTTWN